MNQKQVMCYAIDCRQKAISEIWVDGELWSCLCAEHVYKFYSFIYDKGEDAELEREINCKCIEFLPKRVVNRLSSAKKTRF